MNKTSILVVEDDKPIRNLIVTTLKTHDYKYLVAENGSSAILEASSHNPDIVLLDLGLPDIEGVEVIRKIRTWSNMPIIVISARSEDTDKIEALDAGADDYLVKPFSFQELEARIKALLRRNKETVANQLTCDNLVLDCNIRRAKRGDVDIDLTVKEYRLHEYFMTHQGVALSRITLLKDVWDKNFDTNTNIVDVYVNYLRVKIDRDFDKKLIHTVVGLGYIMNAKTLSTLSIRT